MKSSITVLMFAIFLNACIGNSFMGSSKARTGDTASSGFTCSSGVVALGSGQSTTVIFGGPIIPVTYTLSSTPTLPVGSMGSVVPAATATQMAATYTAPAATAATVSILVTAVPTNSAIASTSCTVRLIPDGAIGVTDDGKTNGLVGNVYQLPTGTQQSTFYTAIDWSTNPQPVATVVMPSLNVPNTPFQNGFPGVQNLVQWFAIKFDGTLIIPTTGAYQFQLASDDGSILYIDGTKVVDDDGVHSMINAAGSATLTAGNHVIHIDYFQGPPQFIALSLSWQPPGATSFSLIPPSAFARPLGH